MASSKKNTPQQLHEPVLLANVLQILAPKKGESFLDLTAGYGGHSKVITGITGVPSEAVLVDRDESAISALRPFETKGAVLLHLDSFQAAKQLLGKGRHFDMILLDCGVSSPQLDVPARGFSFVRSGPLDMRMDQRESKTVADLVNSMDQAGLAKIIHQYGEEPRSRAIAKAIVSSRPFQTTDQLAAVIAKIKKKARTKTHPATRTFQALRIALNRELELLESTLPLLPELLHPGGRLVIISFHSLEDRIVKHFFKNLTEAGYEAQFKRPTKRPVFGADEDVFNPRARSAKLRAVVKINNTKRKEFGRAPNKYDPNSGRGSL